MGEQTKAKWSAICSELFQVLIKKFVKNGA
jgi:hypothetical protein